MNIFLAFSFRAEDKPLVGYIDRLLASQFVQVRTGENLGGGQLTPEVQRRIDECDALVGLLTRREQLASGGWTTHQWVLDELGRARTNGKPAIALVEEGVDPGGMYQPHERIPLDRANPVEALLRLAETVALWKMEMGRPIKVQLAPEEIAAKLGDGTIPCRHRLWQQGKYTDWREVNAVPEAGGTFVYLDGVREDHLIQIRAEEQDKVWQSPATSQWMMVQLKKGGGGK
jgi:hypothetical protein